MKKCIGIISYLPDDEKVREVRVRRLNKLLHKLDEIFNLPIIIIAQNYQDFLPNSDNYILIESTKPLGIVGARKKLRKVFLESNYDCLIMLDDDSDIIGTRENAKKYLDQLDQHPGMFYEFNKSLLKLFAISKEIYENIDFDDINPEKGEGFEDRIFVAKLREKFPDKRFIIEKGKLDEYSISTMDANSTWYTNQDIKQMLNNTEQIIKELKM